MNDLQQPKVVYLGPKYTFSHEAALRMYPHAELFYRPSFREVFQAIQKGDMDYAVLPIENSSTGAIPEVCQLLVEQRYEALKENEVKIKIVKEFYLSVKLHLLARSQMSLLDIKVLYTHRQPQLQSMDFIETDLKHVEIKNTTSTADAAEKLFQDTSSALASACIGSELLAHEKKLTIIKSDIQDVYRNVTRFVGLSSLHNAALRTNKTTVAIIIHDKPGMLVEALQMISSQGINLRSIKTLPVRDDKYFSENFKDWFLLDIEASNTSTKYKHFIGNRNAKKDIIPGLKLLGSYMAFKPEPPLLSEPAKRKKTPPDNRQRMLALLEKTKEGESENVEFKSTLRFNLRTNSADKELPKAVVKTICAFMNADGGTIFIGIGDHKEPIGIDKDIQCLSKKDEDGFISALYQYIVDIIGTEYCQLVHPYILDYQEKRICTVEVNSSNQPAWFNDGNTQTFFLRVGNPSRPLTPKDALLYILKKFKGMGGF
ncbi:MAG: putative DNA binding domain-containing protein [Nitrospirae bacterium]|nr:putative DNA binding domain-containing protein [Nitrospirota bacterium]